MLPNGKAAFYPIITKTVPTFYFIGVTTRKSSIMNVFPLWMAELGHPEIVLEGIDLKIHDQPQAYCQAVARIKYDPLSLGGLVTTHKIDLLDAARHLFEYLDPYAQICGEVSSISKLKGCLEGHAKDPISSGLSLDAILGNNYFSRTGGEVLCFGAGGSALATLLHLVNKDRAGDRPRRFILVNRTSGRLESAQKMMAGLQTDILIEYSCNADPLKNDAMLAAMPPYSLVINATGMGKDIPGSPITDHGLFPLDGVAWEFNYRGELDFMHQALAQKQTRNLHVEDGWLYFVHGWTQVVAQVLHLDLSQELFTRLESIAAQVRKSHIPHLILENIGNIR